MAEFLEARCVSNKIVTRIPWVPAARWSQPTPSQRAATLALYASQLPLWQAHPRFRFSGAEHFVTVEHRRLREDLTDLLSDARKGSRNITKRLNRIARSVAMHNQREENVLFPLILKSAPWVYAHIDELTKDHDALSGLEKEALLHGSEGAVEAFVAALTDHLHREEMLVVPLMLDGHHSESPPIEWSVVLPLCCAAVLTVALVCHVAKAKR